MNWPYRIRPNTSTLRPPAHECEQWNYPANARGYESVRVTKPPPAWAMKRAFAPSPSHPRPPIQERSDSQFLLHLNLPVLLSLRHARWRLHLIIAPRDRESPAGFPFLPAFPRQGA